MMPGPGIKPRTHWWGASTLTTTPSLFPQFVNFLTNVRVSIIAIHVGVVPELIRDSTYSNEIVIESYVITCKKKIVTCWYISGIHQQN